MNLLQFIWKTDRLLFYVPAFFIGVSGYQFGSLEPEAGWALLFAGSLITSVVLVKKAQHRRTLDRRNVQAYVRQLVHNKDTFPFTLPTEADAHNAVSEMFNDPLRP